MRKNFPRRIQKKGEAYYYVMTGLDGKRKWIPITGPDDPSIFRLKEVAEGGSKKWIRSRAISILASAKTRSRQKGKDFTLTMDDLLTLFKRSGGLCEVSGVPLVFGNLKNREDKPWVPSLDRIDASKGYTLDNCRIVCYAANIALSNWGDEVVRKIAFGIAATSRKVSKKCRTVLHNPDAAPSQVNDFIV